MKTLSVYNTPLYNESGGAWKEEISVVSKSPVTDGVVADEPNTDVVSFYGGRASLLPTRTGMISYPLAGISRPLTKVSAKLTSIGRGKLLPLASKPMLASAPRLYMLATVKPASM